MTTTRRRSTGAAPPHLPSLFVESQSAGGHGASNRTLLRPPPPSRPASTAPGAAAAARRRGGEEQHPTGPSRPATRIAARGQNGSKVHVDFPMCRAPPPPSRAITARGGRWRQWEAESTTTRDGEQATSVGGARRCRCRWCWCWRGIVGADGWWWWRCCCWRCCCCWRWWCRRDSRQRCWWQALARSPRGASSARLEGRAPTTKARPMPARRGQARPGQPVHMQKWTETENLDDAERPINLLRLHPWLDPRRGRGEKECRSTLARGFFRPRRPPLV
ncbi:uncharacterized protein PFL1_06592 [Pseudozyma flocculosa PF-1]|uniref:Uncharacterized protein n=1 Tax=Pseudozyma flocculosa PF-1 TaxID=1277687 RepID=A0A061H124_9BASI|nr:uncharacterized protein PFL1_06592 [Pseudozyma flocculosa PF-1]EPQ25918.1 hypothetical protein PFL1_06592 [Pseudozyma flocculosa PF-1]